MTNADATIAVNSELAARDDMIISDGVDKWYGDFQALKGVTATIKEKEVVVVLGPSGSGKSTWIRCINRLEQHQNGRIIVDGVELTNDTRNIEKIRSEVGMVFQSFNLWPHFSAIQNVMEGPRTVLKLPRAEARARAAELLARDHLAAPDGRLEAALHHRGHRMRRLLPHLRRLQARFPGSAGPRQAATEWADRKSVV